MGVRQLLVAFDRIALRGARIGSTGSRLWSGLVIAGRRPAGLGRVLTRVASHYQGGRGEAYFDWWSATASRSATLEARKFIGDVGRDDKVLDFGCGNGALLRELGHTGLGVEPNPAARRAARCRRFG